MTLRHRHSRARGNLAAIVLLLPLSGCLVVSLQPIYDAQSTEFSEGLLGTWDQTDEKASLTIARGAWNAYDVTSVEGAESKRFTAHLTRIGAHPVLDLTTATGVETPTGMVRVHWPLLIDQQGGTLSVRALDYDWFKDRLNQKPLAGLAAAFDGEENVVIAASTKAVRDWLVRHLASADVWAEPTTFQRRVEVPARERGAQFARGRRLRRDAPGVMSTRAPGVVVVFRFDHPRKRSVHADTTNELTAGAGSAHGSRAGTFEAAFRRAG